MPLKFSLPQAETTVNKLAKSAKLLKNLVFLADISIQLYCISTEVKQQGIHPIPYVTFERL